VLYMQVYKESRLQENAPGCAPLLTMLAEDTPQEVDLNENGNDGVNVDSADIEGPQTQEHQEYDCSWYIQRSENGTSWGAWKKRPQTFTKGTALSIEAFVGLMLSYTICFLTGGMDRLRLCWDKGRLLRFSIPGGLFGFSAVCGFLAQDSLSPGSYALYSQGGIVAVAIMWRLVFNKALPSTTWVHILLIAGGIVMYNISEVGLDRKVDSVGLMWITIKMITTGAASVVAELFLKSEPDMPLCVQTAYIFPWKSAMCFATIWLLPPHGAKFTTRPGGFFHDWTFMTVLLVAHNLFDTVMSATVAKVFDSIVKAVCSVVGIICPTWIVSYALGWDRIAFGTAKGQLKMSGGILVVVSSFAYVFGRRQAKRCEELQTKCEELEQKLSAEKRENVLGSAEVRFGATEMT